MDARTLGTRIAQQALPPTVRLSFILTVVVAMLLISGRAAAQAEGGMITDENDFAELDLVELMNIEVIEVNSIAGVDQKLLTTPAAMTVITGEDMKSTGHRLIPEALRLVPGMQVGRINAMNWAISSRGFPSRFANKLQVLMDGRVVFEPLFAGTFWHEQQLLLDDLDQIEVIRGPGATLWGSNAVNGVINIQTKRADETQGLLFELGGGLNAEHFAGFRYGGTAGEHGHYRVWGLGREFSGQANPDGSDTNKDWVIGRGGIRFDLDGDESTRYTFEAIAFDTPHFGEVTFEPVPGSHLTSRRVERDGHGNGHSFRFRVERYDSSQEGWTFQTYYDHDHIAGLNGYELTHDVLEADFRRNMVLDDRHTLLWGVNVNFLENETRSTPFIGYTPPGRSLIRYMVFVQDTITMVEDRWFAMIGTKLEHNEFTGFEWQPSARVWWTPDERQTVWGAVSRPVRTPSQTDQDLFLVGSIADTGLLSGGPPSGMFVPLAILGDPDVESETLLSFELGYRALVTDDLTIDVATFYNDYDDLVDTPPAGFGLFTNRATADTYGIETAIDWVPSDNITLRGTYSFMRLHVHGDTDLTPEGQTAQHQASLRTTINLTEDLDLHGAAYYVDSLAVDMIPSYIRLDVGLTWRPRDNVEISIWGQNLLDPEHPEFGSAIFPDPVNQIERSLYAQVSLKF